MWLIIREPHRRLKAEPLLEEALRGSGGEPAADTRTQLKLRPATQDDLDVLWDFLAIAAYEPDGAAAKAVPFVAAHLSGWRRSGDFGFIAEIDGDAIGAAWARHIPAEDNPFHIDDRSPVVTIAVRDGARSRASARSLR